MVFILTDNEEQCLRLITEALRAQGKPCDLQTVYDLRIAQVNAGAEERYAINVGIYGEERMREWKRAQEEAA